MGKPVADIMVEPSTTVKLAGVTKRFLRPNGTEKIVLQDLDLSFRGSQITTICGRNGAGKSTLLSLIAGISQPSSGVVDVRGPGGRAARIGFVWQDYRSSLLPWMCAVDNITFPLRLRGTSSQERNRLGTELMKEFMPGVSPATRSYQLSGGQQQLVCLLRCAIDQPDVLLLDEPFSALDQVHSWTMALYVERMWMALRIPVLFVSHDIDEAILLADEIVVLAMGGVVVDRIANDLPRPRTLAMLTTGKHISYRARLLEALRTMSSPAINDVPEQA